MKKILALLLCLVFISPIQGKAREPLKRGLFVTVLDEPPVLSSRDKIRELIHSAKALNVDTLFIQIYRANKAWFPSRVADASPYEHCLKEMGEDPFSFLIKEAHKEGIEVHAWLNLLSLSQNEHAPLLEKYGPEILTRNSSEKKTLQDYKIDNQYFLEAGDLRVRRELVHVVEDVLGAYPELDGIQFDYIRYPDRHPAYGYTQMNLERFKKAAGIETFEEENPKWKEWKRAQVTELLTLLAGKARSLRPGIQVSTTGCMSYIRAYHEALQDWPSWLQTGLIDFVTLMCYVRDTSEFRKYLSEIPKHASNPAKVNIAVDAYDLLQKPQTFQEQFRLCEQESKRACVIFHYGSLRENPRLESPFTVQAASSK